MHRFMIFFTKLKTIFIMESLLCCHVLLYRKFFYTSRGIMKYPIALIYQEYILFLKDTPLLPPDILQYVSFAA